MVQSHIAYYHDRSRSPATIIPGQGCMPLRRRWKQPGPFSAHACVLTSTVDQNLTRTVSKLRQLDSNFIRKFKREVVFWSYVIRSCFPGVSTHVHSLHQRRGAPFRVSEARCTCTRQVASIWRVDVGHEERCLLCSKHRDRLRATKSSFSARSQGNSGWESCVSQSVDFAHIKGRRLRTSFLSSWNWRGGMTSALVKPTSRTNVKTSRTWSRENPRNAKRQLSASITVCLCVFVCCTKNKNSCHRTAFFYPHFVESSARLISFCGRKNC